MIRALLLSFGLILGTVQTLAAESVVAGLSQDNIGITASFDGSEILIYGAVKRESPFPSQYPLHVIVTLEGPSETVKIRRKSREMGVWVNTDSVTVGAAPAYYSIATSGPIEEILDPTVDVRERIGIPLAVRAFSGPIEVSDARPFTQALLRIRENDGLYTLNEGGVHLLEQTLFRADFHLPSNLIEGDYKTRIFLLRNGQMVDKYQTAIYVRKVGLERWLYMLSRDYAALYGLLALAIAVFAGWSAAAVFRLFRA